MSHAPLEFQDVLELVELIKASSNFSEIRLRSGEVEVELRRHGGGSLGGAPALRSAPAHPAQPAAPSVVTEAPGANPASGTNTTTVVAEDAPVARGAATATAAASRSKDAVVVRAPMVGTLYHAPEPGAAPFVGLGQQVKPGDPICIVEVMKLMNSVQADCTGIVTEILVGDGEPVEFGQALFVIERAAGAGA